MSTEVQADVSGALSELGFESLGAEMPGAPHKLRATEATVNFVQSLVEDDKVLVVRANGDLTIE